MANDPEPDVLRPHPAPLPLTWTPHPGNPLLSPPWPEPVLADPTFLPPAQTPDGQYQLIAHRVIGGLYQYRSADGLVWTPVGRIGHGLRPFLVAGAGTPQGFALVYERLRSPFRSELALRHSADLVRWSRPVTLRRPELPWEGGWLVRTAGNPCLLRRDGGWWLYFSAGLVWLADCGFPEPRHVGLARAERLEGPYEPHPTPLLSPSWALPHRNLGAGAIKVLEDPAWPGLLLGFHNGIYRDAAGRSRSALRLLTSTDGLAWSEAAAEPILGPTPGWSAALVYALDVRRVGRELRLYYNARDGWRSGRERIGLATWHGAP